MTADNLEAIARRHIAQAIDLRPIPAPRDYTTAAAARTDDCAWFSVDMGDKRLIGPGLIIGVRKQDGVVIYFGSDSGE